MTNKVGIGVEASFDSSRVDAGLSKVEARVNRANKTAAYNPISREADRAIETTTRKLEQLMRVDTALRRRLRETGQDGLPFEKWDMGAMYPNAANRRRKEADIRRYLGGEGGALPPSGGGGGAGFGGMAAGAAQAGLRAAGPVGGVAANALGTGMSAGFGAGLMGLMGGMLALGVGKIVSSAMEKVGQAEDNSVALDKLKRTIGDVNVSFNALKAAVHGGADNLKITYAEAGQLSQQFVKLGNVTSDQYKSIGDELGVGVGLSRSLGLDPSQGVGVLGQMRGIGVTTNTQESRRFALLIGETIGKSGAFAKADEVMDALANYTASQTRNNMGVANVAGFAGLFSGMVGSGIPGLDPQGAAGLIGRINASLSGGGSKGEASQFFTGMVGSDMGLDPIQTQIMREGGAFATNESMFGEGSAARRFGISGPGGNQTFLQATIARLRRQYGNNKGLLAQATANHLGIGINQAMALLSVGGNEMGEMQKYGDIGKLSSSGIGNLSKALYGSASDRQSLAQSLLGRDDVSQSDKDKLKSVMGTSSEREVLAALTAQYDQERTQGSDIRDSKNALDNIKTNIADKLVPVMQEMRHGIMAIAGVGKGKTSEEIMADVINADSAGRARAIGGRFSGQIGSLQDRQSYLQDKARSLDPAALAYTYRDKPEILEQKLKERADVQRELTETEKKIAALEAEKAALLKKENERRDAEIKQMQKDAEQRAMAGVQAVPAGFSAGAGRGFINPGMPGAAPGGRTFTTGSSAPGDFDALFEKYGRQYGVDPRILKAIAMKESSMRPNAVGGLNANGTRDYGLMQHNSAFLGERGLANGEWANPERSVEEAAKLLAGNIKRAGGDIRGGVRRYNGSGPRAEAYADDIMAAVPGFTVNGSTPAPSAPSAGAGRGGSQQVYGSVDVNVRIGSDGRLYGPHTPIPTRVGPPVPFGAQASW